MTLRSIEDVLMVCDTCGSTFRLGDCEAKDGPIRPFAVLEDCVHGHGRNTFYHGVNGG